MGAISGNVVAVGATAGQVSGCDAAPAQASGLSPVQGDAAVDTQGSADEGSFQTLSDPDAHARQGADTLSQMGRAVTFQQGSSGPDGDKALRPSGAVPAASATAATPDSDRAHLVGFNPVPSYHGDLPAHRFGAYITSYEKGGVRAGNRYDVPPTPDELRHFSKVTDPDHVRQMIRDAAEYHHVPPELLSGILGTEARPLGAIKGSLQEIKSSWEKGFNRQTEGLRIDPELKRNLDEVPQDSLAKPFAKSLARYSDKLGNGSTGLANMKPTTLDKTGIYFAHHLGYPVLPAGVAARADKETPGWADGPVRPGDNLEVDIYSLAGHVRQLVDQTTKVTDYRGPISKDQAMEIIGRYNGGENFAGRQAQVYAQGVVWAIEAAGYGGAPLIYHK